MHTRYPKCNKLAHCWFSILVALVLFGLGLLVSLLVESNRRAEARGIALEEATRMARQIEQHLTQNLSSTYALAALVRQGRGEVREFAPIAREFLALHPGTSALQLAPDGIIRDIEPMAGNEKAVGHNLLLDEKRNKEARLAVKTGHLTLAGPFELIQGGTAIVGRLPVYLDNERQSFWGFAIALIRMDKFLKTTHIDDLDQQGYHYELWREHPDSGERHVFARSQGALAADAITASFAVSNGRWHLSLSPADGWTSMTWLAAQLLLAALIAAFAGWSLSRYLATQRALATSSERYKTLYRKTPAIMHSIDAEGRLVSVSDHWLKTFGYAEDEVIGHKSIDFLTPDSQQYAREHALPEFFRTGRIIDIPYQFVAKDGCIFDVLLSAISECDTEGKVVRSLAVMTDVTEQKAMHDRLVLSETSLLEAQSIAHIGNWAYHLAARELFWSTEVFKILELDPATPPSSQCFMDRVHPDDREQVKLSYHVFRSQHRPYEITCRLLLPDGTLKYISQHSRVVVDERGTPLRLVGTLQDVTLQALQDIALKESEDRFRTIADYTYDWEYWQGTQQEILYISPSCERITGYTATDFICNPDLMARIVHPEDKEIYLAHKREIPNQPHGDMTFRIITKAGQVRWIAHGCRAVYSRDGTPCGRRGSNRDITALKEAEQLAHQLAYFDSLTNLPNRRMLMDRLLQALAQAKRFERALAIMFIDLDRFKQVNDTLGHDAGDKLLVEVATRLTRSVREGDTVARTGGDEFIIILPEIAHPGDATTVAEKIIETVDQPVQINGRTLHTSPSIGIAVYPINGSDDAEELMKKADIAMYEAKQAGRNRYRMFQL